MASRVVNGDAGLNLLKKIEQAKKQEVAVGLPKEKGFGNYGNGITVLDVGVFNEYGTPTTPQRSFLRTPFLVEDIKLQKLIESQWKKIVNNRKSVKGGLNFVGVNAVGISQKAFTNKGYGQWIDIKQGTKNAKGSSQILIDTGLLRQSVTYAVRDNK